MERRIITTEVTAEDERIETTLPPMSQGLCGAGEENPP